MSPQLPSVPEDPPSPESSPAPDPAGLVLIAYDGSPNARAAIRRAGALFPGRRAMVVTAWSGITEAAPELLLLPGGLLTATIGALGDALRERAETLAAEGAVSANAAGLEAESRAIHSGMAVWHGIVGFADDNDVAVIVLGARGHAAIAAALLGSVATGVLHHAGRPVLIVSAQAGEPPRPTLLEPQDDEFRAS